MKIDLQPLSRFLRARTGALETAFGSVEFEPSGARRIATTLTGGAEAGDHVLVFAPGRDASSARRDFAMRKALWNAGVTTMEPIWLDAEGAAFEEPGCFMRGFVADVPINAARSELSEVDGDRLVFQLGQDIARLHAIDLDGLPGDLEFPPPFNPDWAAQRARALREKLDNAELADPIFELALKWSIESAPVIAAPTLVHGDFSTRNILLRDGAVALIDGLGSICRSDPMEDLGSFFARVSRGRVQDRAAGGIGSREAFLAGYCDIAGAHSIAQDRIEYWAIVATLRAGIEASIKGALRGHPHSSEEFLCALEAQYDLLLDIAEAKAERR